MANLPNRSDYEKKLAAIVGNKLDAACKKILAALGDPPSVENIPESVWVEIGDGLTTVIRPQLEQVYSDSAQNLGADAIVKYELGETVVDWTMVNERAAEWAKRYTFDLVKGINETSKTNLQGDVSDFFKRHQTMGELRDKIAETYSPARASVIAITETTRASVMGEITAINEIELNSSLKMVSTWNTENDDITCDECASRNQTTADEGGWEGEEPPAHPGCRCWLNWAPEGW